MFQIAHAITNLDRSFAEADEAYCQMLQFTPSELCKRDVMSITYSADRADNCAALNRLIDYGSSFWIRKRYIRNDGGLVGVLNHVARVIGTTGTPRIAATIFILPPDALGRFGNGLDQERLAEQTDALRKLL